MREMQTDQTHGLDKSYQSLHRLDGKHGVAIETGSFGIAVKYVWRNDGGKILDIHLRACLFVHLVERTRPFQEGKEDFKAIPVALRKEAASQMQTMPSLLFVWKL